MGHHRRRRHVVRRALVHRDPPALLPHRPGREGRHHTHRRLDWDELKAFAEGVQRGRRAVGHLPPARRPGLVADVHAVRLAERRRAGRGRRVHARHPADGGGAGLLRASTPRGSRRPTSRMARSRPASSTYIGAFVSGPWHMCDPARPAGPASTASGPSRPCRRGRRDVLRRRRRPRGVQGRREPRDGVEVRRLPHPARGSSRSSTGWSAPARRPERVGDRRARRGPDARRRSATSSRTRSRRPRSPTWEQVASVLDDEIEKVSLGKADPGRRGGSAIQGATAIGFGG